MTVVWSLPPNCRPISGRESLVFVRHKYIAIWRGTEIFLVRFLDLISDIQDIDTTEVEPLLNVLEEFSETRDDIPKMKVDRDTALKNAPDTDGVYYQVPPTIKHNKENMWIKFLKKLSRYVINYYIIKSK